MNRLNTKMAAAAVAVCTILVPLASAQDYDIVILNGRVIDPETNLDAVRNVGIRGDTIVEISTKKLIGENTIDGEGLVVAPGFIDLHMHVQTQEGYRLMALDGVTTALEFENGVPDIQAFLAAREGKSPIHFGATASHNAARHRAWNTQLPDSKNGPSADISPPAAGSPVASDAATPAQLDLIRGELQRQITSGALGIGMLLEYTPGATRQEVIEVFKVAAAHGVPVYLHARSAGRIEPGSSVEAISEAIAAAAISGASVHIAHIKSQCLSDSPSCLAMIAGARERGLDVTTEAYPYTVGMTYINSAFFNPGWRENRSLDYDDIELPESGERLTHERFDALRAQPDRPVLIHMIPDEVVDAIVAHPLVAIASDGLSLHPRGAGTHARVLARYVRKQGTITLNEAIRKLSLLPAQRLEGAMPGARRMGRIQKGARADIVVFDAQTIQDRATLRAPTEASVGVRFLVVSGTLVVDEGQVVDGVAPGLALMRGLDR
jgi:N-acyl-D-aspartate/D-glutamate deacylase